MAIVRASCPCCGDCTIAPGEVTIYETDSRRWYTFPCPNCTDLISKPCSDLISTALREVRVKCISFGSPPDEVFEAHRPGKLTGDDVLTLHNALVDGTAYERITTVV